MLSPIVRGLSSVSPKAVVCGTSLSLTDVREAVATGALKDAGENATTFTLITHEFKPLQHDDFRALLSRCLREKSRVAEFDLPDDVFPGVVAYAISLFVRVSPV